MTPALSVKTSGAEGGWGYEKDDLPFLHRGAVADGCRSAGFGGGTGRGYGLLHPVSGTGKVDQCP